MTEGSFTWKVYLRKSNLVAAPVSSFNHVALSRCWENILTIGVLVEVKSPDCTTCCTATPCCYWIAAVINVSGFMGLLRYEGFDSDDSMDMWVNLCSEPHVHPIGWCTENGMPLVPPKCIEDKHTDWKEYLMRRISRVRTIPADFAFKVEEHKHSMIKRGMNVEASNKNCTSAIRVAAVSEVVGGRLRLTFEDPDTGEDEFWCHERSSALHPVGWAQVVGHPLQAKPEYALTSLSKTLCRTFEPNDATWDMFLTVPHFVKNMKFREGMKLEAIDPLNLSSICVATVSEMLRNNYMMIEIDSDPTDPSHCFSCHSSSAYIFPIGFCETNCLELTPPKGHKGEFKWHDYLRKTKSKPAPPALFYKEIPNHRFQEGMYIEAVDLMEPKLICVALICKVIGRLLKIHFDGWEDTFDQWCDCESPDLYPIGWCEAVGYRLEPPRTEAEILSDKDKKNQKSATKTRRRKKRTFTPRRKNLDDFSGLNIKLEPEESDDGQDAVAVSVEDSNSD